MAHGGVGYNSPYEKAHRIRRERLQKARTLGTHTKEQWETIKAEFNGRCVRCGRDGWFLSKDHITPLWEGGSDGVENLQPLCGRCNCGKGGENYNWAEHRRNHGFDL